jgi:hypothetical protein
MTELEAEIQGLTTVKLGKRFAEGPMGKGTGLSREQFEKKYGPSTPETFEAVGERAAAAGEPTVASGEKGHPVLSKFEQGVEERMGGSGYVTELGQRGVKGVGTGAMAGVEGLYGAEAGAGRELEAKAKNRYASMIDPITSAKADIPRIQHELDQIRMQTDYLRGKVQRVGDKETTFQYGVGSHGPAQKAQKDRFDELTTHEHELVRTLRQAERASKGDLSDEYYGTLGEHMRKEGEHGSKVFQETNKAWEKKWAPYIDKKWDSDWGVELSTGLGETVGAIGTSMIHPAVGLVFMQGQNFKNNQDQYDELMKKQGKTSDPAERDAWAWNKATNETVLEIPGGLAMSGPLKKGFKMAAQSIPRNIEKFSAREQGKIWGEVLEETLSETLVTTPGQTLIGRQEAEKLGQEPLTREQAQREQLGAAGMSLAQSAVLGGAGITSAKVGEARAAAKTEAIKEKLAAAPKQPTFAEYQETQKAKMKPGTYRNFADIPAEPPGTPAKTSINIGLNLGDRENALTPDVIHKVLEKEGVKVVTSEIKNSSYGEPTAVVSIARPMNADQAHRVSTALNQEAIAQKTGEFEPQLYGREAGKWGPYKEEGYVSPTEVPTTATTGTETPQSLGWARPPSPVCQLRPFRSRVHRPVSHIRAAARSRWVPSRAEAVRFRLHEQAEGPIHPAGQLR